MKFLSLCEIYFIFLCKLNAAGYNFCRSQNGWLWGRGSVFFYLPLGCDGRVGTLKWKRLLLDRQMWSSREGRDKLRVGRPGQWKALVVESILEGPGEQPVMSSARRNGGK